MPPVTFTSGDETKTEVGDADNQPDNPYPIVN